MIIWLYEALDATKGHLGGIQEALETLRGTGGTGGVLRTTLDVCDLNWWKTL